ncbi:hypothetical protein A0256_05840 [Mucilaginibacter sp. PAMC 26640]|nr:hypothetical protein A0256_05840 [Mucilaginibacter sp. PAMC 26640]
MKKFKQFLRLCSLVLFLFLALTGIAVTGAAPPPSKKQNDFIDSEILIELVDKKKSEDDAENESNLI